jgi:hypothetical protein
MHVIANSALLFDETITTTLFTDTILTWTHFFVVNVGAIAFPALRLYMRHTHSKYKRALCTSEINWLSWGCGMYNYSRLTIGHLRLTNMHLRLAIHLLLRWVAHLLLLRWVSHLLLWIAHLLLLWIAHRLLLWWVSHWLLLLIAHRWLLILLLLLWIAHRLLYWWLLRWVSHRLLLWIAHWWLLILLLLWWIANWLLWWVSHRLLRRVSHSLRWVLTSRSIEGRWWHINGIMHGRLTISECHWWSNINFSRISLLKLLTSRMPFSS